MKKIIVLLLLLIISTSLSACGKKVLKIDDIFFLNVYKASNERVNYNANPQAIFTIGTDKKKIERILGKGQAYSSITSAQTIYYSGGLTVLYNSDTAELFDYTLDETSLPNVRKKAFSLFKDVNLSSDIKDITAKLGENYFVLKSDAKGSPAQIVFVYEMINGEYGHQFLPNSSTPHTEQVNALTANDNAYAIMLYVDSNPRYQELYRIKIGQLSQVLAFRND